MFRLSFPRSTSSRGAILSTSRSLVGIVAITCLLFGALTIQTPIAWAEPAAPGALQHQVWLPFISATAPLPTAVPTPSVVDDWRAFSTIEYVVQPGDTLASIAVDFGRDVADLQCASLSNTGEPLVLEPGQVLSIPALGTVCHVVQPGDTIASLASFYGVSEAAIVDNAWNRLATVDTPLQPGQLLRITGALDPRFMPLTLVTPREPVVQTLPTPVPSTEWPYGDGHFIWPLVGAITQDASPMHRAIDIDAEWGDVVVAADTGTVVKAGWNDQGLGYRVVIDHHIDYITLYAHLSTVLVKEGDLVRKGQPIGLAGDTGNSTGVHLHFAIWDYGVAVNPLDLLPSVNSPE